MTGVTVNGVTTSYAYDHQNIRIGKTGTTDKNYFVDGTKIIAENIGTTQRLVYFYDGDSLVGFRLHDGTDLIYPKATLEDGYCYQYVRDEQNNVIGLTDCIGTLVARYEYDAWGNHKVLDANGVVNTNPNFIGNLNPFRYRGYYYDVETGLYYCNARYYSPLLRRWISPDAFSYLDPKTFCGIDLYCYCNNDPVNYADPSGHFSFTACAIAIGINMAFVFIEDIIDGGLGDGSHDWKDYLGATVSGFFGGLSGTGKGIVKYMTEFAFSVAGDIVGAVLSDEFEENGFLNTIGNIVVSNSVSFVLGQLAKGITSKGRTRFLKNLNNNQAANKILKKMGLTIKMGSNKAKRNLFKIIFESDWIGNIVSEGVTESFFGNFLSLIWGMWF